MTNISNHGWSRFAKTDHGKKKQNRAAEFIGNMEEAKVSFSWERLVDGLEKVDMS